MKNDITESHLALLKSIDKYFNEPTPNRFKDYKTALEVAIKAEERNGVTIGAFHVMWDDPENKSAITVTATKDIQSTSDGDLIEAREYAEWLSQTVNYKVPIIFDKFAVPALQSEYEKTHNVGTAAIKTKRKKKKHRFSYTSLAAIFAVLVPTLLITMSFFYLQNQSNIVEPRYEIAGGTNTAFYFIDEQAYLEFTAVENSGLITHTIMWTRPDGSQGSQSVTINSRQGRHAYPLDIPIFPCTVYRYYGLRAVTTGDDCGTGGSPSINNSEGSLIIDSDADGIPDSQDGCPTTPGVSEQSGCPLVVIAPNPNYVCNVGSALENNNPLIRSTPSTNGDTVGVIFDRYSNIFRVIGSQEANGELWYQIAINNTLQGWVRSDVVEIAGVDCDQYINISENE